MLFTVLGVIALFLRERNINSTVSGQDERFDRQGGLVMVPPNSDGREIGDWCEDSSLHLEEQINVQTEEPSLEEPVDGQSEEQSLVEPVSVHGEEQSLVEPVSVHGEEQSLVEPVSVHGEEPSLVEPDSVHGEEQSLVEPVSVHGEEPSLVEPDSVHGEEQSLVEPDSVHGEEQSLVEPDSVHGEEQSLVEPVSVHGEKPSLVEPDSVHSEELSLVEPDSVHGEEQSLVEPDSVHGEEQSLVEPDSVHSENSAISSSSNYVPPKLFYAESSSSDDFPQEFYSAGTNCNSELTASSYSSFFSAESGCGEDLSTDFLSAESGCGEDLSTNFESAESGCGEDLSTNFESAESGCGDDPSTNFESAESGCGDDPSPNVVSTESGCGDDPPPNMVSAEPGCSHYNPPNVVSAKPGCKDDVAQGATCQTEGAVPSQPEKLKDKDTHIIEINSQRYEIGAELGKGGFGTVFAGTRLEDGLQVAVKIVNCKVMRLIRVGGFEKPVPAEIALHFLATKGPKIKQIVELLDWKVEPQRYIIVVERPIPCVTLREFLNDNKEDIAEDVLRKIMFHVTIAAHTCCQRGVFHRDIKPDNLLINPETFEVKLIDFGCSALLTKDCYQQFSGTRLFAPPEFVNTGRYHGEPSTVWSLGIVQFLLMFKNFPTVTDLLQLNSRDLEIPRRSKECSDFIRACLQLNTDFRYKLHTLRAHAWFKDEN